MAVNLELIFSRPLLIIGLALGLILIKFLVLLIVAKQANLSLDASLRLGLIIPQGGEFAFVLLGGAIAANIITQSVADKAVAVVTVSMMISPILYTMYEQLSKQHIDERETDAIEPENDHVIIVGFGRFGQIVARILNMENIPFTALEKDPAQVDFVRKFGSKIYYGDASRLDVLHAANVHDARALVIAIDDIEQSLLIAEIVRKHFPDLTILAKAINRQHAFKLMDLDIKIVIRETLDGSLHMTEDLLGILGYQESDAIHAIKLFREHDEALLLKQHAIHHDEQALILSAKDAREELKQIFKTDKHNKD